MLLSRRRHVPQLDGASVALDRVLFATWILRRAHLPGLIQDERPVAARIHGGAARRRHWITIVLSGRVTMFVGERTTLLERGGVFVSPAGTPALSRAEGCEVIEIDAEPDAAIIDSARVALQTGRLSGRALSRIDALAVLLARGDVNALGDGCRDAFAALAAEGAPVDARALEGELAAARTSPDQALVDALDETLSNLPAGPAVVSLEDRLGTSRRSVSRRVTDLHERYALSAFGRTDFRSMRDFYRLVVGTVLTSHPATTTRSLAGMLGYASPDALCHAFANAGLPSPLALGGVVRAG